MKIKNTHYSFDIKRAKKIFNQSMWERQIKLIGNHTIFTAE
jgi:hypothetical protein